MASLRSELPRDPETLQAMLIAREAEIERLRQIIKELQRHRFGRRAETLPEDHVTWHLIMRITYKRFQMLRLALKLRISS